MRPQKEKGYIMWIPKLVEADVDGENESFLDPIIFLWNTLLVVVTSLTSSNRILDSSIALDQFQFLIFRLYRSFPACLFD